VRGAATCICICSGALCFVVERRDGSVPSPSRGRASLPESLGLGLGKGSSIPIEQCGARL